MVPNPIGELGWFWSSHPEPEPAQSEAQSRSTGIVSGMGRLSRPRLYTSTLMLTDPANFEVLYMRMSRRDPDLDGVVFVGVRTTGIYCRPVCRARLPLKKNVVFFTSAAAAEVEGYRPCLRCRPETAPFSAAWNGTKTTVMRALSMIDEGALDGASVQTLANRLGIGPRHLCRLFAEHLDASPIQVARTRRIQRAKRLLDETNLAIGEVALRAGFGSPRTMRAAFYAIYGRSPSELRARRRTKGEHNAGGRD